MLSERIDQGLVIISAHSQMQRANDMAYKFEQEANFWWLTGISAPLWRLVMAGEKSYLVRPDGNETNEIFNGSLSSEEAARISGIDNVLTPAEYKTLLVELAKQYDEVHSIGEDPSEKWYDFTLNPASKKLNRSLQKVFEKTSDCRADLKKLRALKQPEEIEALEAAITTTIEAFAAVKNNLATVTHEYEIEAYFNSEFRRSGLEGHAYDPIVAGGKNACTLHYGTNNSDLPKNGLVLLDIGAKANGYAADITRTYAIGTPSKRQVEVHVAVETAHRKIIDLIKPGVTFKKYQIEVDEIMKTALQEIGLLKDRDDHKTYRTYFPHAVSHGLGLDVHESLGGFTEFMPGMVLTVEPGIYIPEERIGVRIEDDVLVTSTGNKNLSAALPTSL